MRDVDICFELLCKYIALVIYISGSSAFTSTKLKTRNEIIEKYNFSDSFQYVFYY